MRGKEIYSLRERIADTEFLHGNGRESDYSDCFSFVGEIAVA